VKKLIFELEFITPAFIGGADKQAELRPASFVGLLRWWWRALKGECDIEKLKKEEIEIFGGNGRKASPVYLRVEGDVSKGRNLVAEYGLDWHFDKSRHALTGSHAGVGYLYYSVTALNKREFIKAGSRLRLREFIKAGSRLRLTLIGEDESLKHYTASLWALVFLGGVGFRSRRGGGNLAVIDYNLKDLGISFIPTDNFGEWLEENLKRAKDLVDSSKPPCDEYSNLSNFKLLLSPREFDTWIEALNDIGSKFMNFRVKNRQRVFDLAVFGLPVRHSNGQFVKAEKGITRRASPVIIKVVKISKGKYMWVVLWLSGKFLPNDVKLTFDGNTQFPSFELVEKFFQELKKEG
jgi:CRISPR-associated protein Cmr1